MRDFLTAVGASVLACVILLVPFVILVIVGSWAFEVGKELAP